MWRCSLKSSKSTTRAFLEDGFAPDDAWGMALNYEDEEEAWDLEEDDEQPIPDGYSGEGFLGLLKKSNTS